MAQAEAEPPDVCLSVAEATAVIPAGYRKVISLCIRPVALERQIWRWEN